MIANKSAAGPTCLADANSKLPWQH